MELYTINKTKYNFDIDISFNQGFYGKIYLFNNSKCLKIFKEPVQRNNQIDFEEKTYNQIKKLKLDNFYKLYDLYYNRELTKILGYLSKYYQSENVDILTMPTEYTLDNLCKLYNSFKKLSEHHIYTNDIHSGNVIINSKDIIVIDTDLYYKSSIETIDVILKENIYNLSDLFVDIYLSSLSKYNFPNKYDKVNITSKIQTLFTMNTISGTDSVIKKLIKYKYPIDYLKKK